MTQNFMEQHSMSYSFKVRAADKASAKAQIEDQFKKIVDKQAVHSQDFAQASSAAGAFIDLLGDDDTRDVTAEVSGSVSHQVRRLGRDRFRGETVADRARDESAAQDNRAHDDSVAQGQTRDELAITHGELHVVVGVAERKREDDRRNPHSNYYEA
jgi:hypothetical protein